MCTSSCHAWHTQICLANPMRFPIFYVQIWVKQKIPTHDDPPNGAPESQLVSQMYSNLNLYLKHSSQRLSPLSSTVKMVHLHALNFYKFMRFWHLVRFSISVFPHKLRGTLVIQDACRLKHCIRSHSLVVFPTLCLLWTFYSEVPKCFDDALGQLAMLYS